MPAHPDAGPGADRVRSHRF